MGLGGRVVDPGNLRRVTEAVHDDLDLVGPHVEGRRNLLATEPAEVLVLPLFVDMMGYLVVSGGLTIGHPHLAHSVEAVLGHVAVLVVPGGQVVEPVRIGDLHGRHDVRPAVSGRVALPVDVSAVVGELNLPAEPQGLVDGVHVREHALALRLDPAGDVDTALQERPLVVAGEQLDVGHQRVALPLRQRLARLHRVNHEHELVELEVPPDYGVLHRVPLVGPDVAPELQKHLDVAVDALALGLDAELPQPLDDLPHRQAVLRVGLLLEDLLDIEGLQLGLVVVCQGRLTASGLGACPTNMPSILPQDACSEQQGVP